MAGNCVRVNGGVQARDTPGGFSKGVGIGIEPRGVGRSPAFVKTLQSFLSLS